AAQLVVNKVANPSVKASFLDHIIENVRTWDGEQYRKTDDRPLHLRLILRIGGGTLGKPEHYRDQIGGHRDKKGVDEIKIKRTQKNGRIPACDPKSCGAYRRHQSRGDRDARYRSGLLFSRARNNTR